MIKLEKTDVCGWETAIRGMRNPMNSWEKSDSEFDVTYYWDDGETPYQTHKAVIGENDLGLMKRLAKAGSDHRKYLRMIIVSADITAPLYWWKEYDTYKVGTVTNSCSTMHKIHERDLTLRDFSCEYLDGEMKDLLKMVISYMNCCRGYYESSKRKEEWYQIIQMLPTSYNQKRTVMLNYEVLCNMYHSRRNHKLDEWHTFCEWIESLPYSELITGEDNGNT